MNMQKNFKGRIVVNGAHVEVEAETPSDLATIISNVVHSPKMIAQVVKTRGPLENTGNRVKRKYSFRNGRQNGYYKWTEKDIVTLAKLAREWGSVRTGLSEKAYKLMRTEGDVKERSRLNIALFVDRFHRYFHVGNSIGIKSNILEILNKNDLYVLSQTKDPQAA